MSSNMPDGCDGMPSTASGHGIVIISAPTLEEVRQAMENPVDGAVMIGYLVVEVCSGVLRPVHYHKRKLTQIRKVVWQGDSDEISFVGRSADGPEHLMSTSFTYYQVVLRQNNSESTMRIVSAPRRL